jgi:hypothetical protein
MRALELAHTIEQREQLLALNDAQQATSQAS